MERRQASIGMPVLRHRRAVVAFAGIRSGQRQRRERSAPGPGASFQRARLGAGTARGQMPELPRDFRVRGHPRGAALRFLRLAGHRAARRSGRCDHAAELAAVQGERWPDSRCHPEVVWQPLVRAESAQDRRPDRYPARHLSAVLDVRCARGCAVDGRSRALLLRQRNLHPERPEPDAKGAQGALGAGRRSPRAFFR